MNDSPAFQFYPKDFLADPNTIVMSATEIGVYWLLICACWINHGLPADTKQLAKLCRIPVSRMQKLFSTNVQACFYFCAATQKYQHGRLDKERAKQLEWREKSRVGGTKSGEVRSKGGSRVVEPNGNQSGTVVEPNGNTAVCSLQSSSSSAHYSEEREVGAASQQKPSRTRKTMLITDDEWLDGLQAQECYSSLEIRLIYQKAQNWCETNGRTCTRKFFVNWLNKERPMSPAALRKNGNGSSLWERNKAATEQAQREFEEEMEKRNGIFGL